MESLIVRKLGVIKIAQAYNPERHAGDLGLSRMGMWWMLRKQFSRAKKYTEKMDAYQTAPPSTKPGSSTATPPSCNRAPRPRMPTAPEPRRSRRARHARRDGRREVRRFHGAPAG